MNQFNEFKTIFQKTLPVMAGYLVIGIGYGMYSASTGYGIGWVFPISAFVYAGSLQYVLVDLLHHGASILTTALTSLLVNARHVFYGISMLERYKDLGSVKPYVVCSLTDETYSLVCQKVPEGIKPGKYYFWVSLLDHIYWITGSCIGALLGKTLPIQTDGIAFSMTALFLTVFLDQWKETTDHFPAIIGVLVSVGCLLLFGASTFLVPTMILIILFLLGRKRQMESRVDHE